MVKSLTDKNFAEETKNGVVLVDFWATWCGPCRMQGPVIDQLDEEMGDKVTFTKVDIIFNILFILSLPSLFLLKRSINCFKFRWIEYELLVFF